jgi:hypothetical protein
MNVKDRLLKFLEHENMSQGRFEKHVGLSNGFINNIGTGISTISLNKIKEKYPQLNIQWLLKGEGEMLVSEVQDYDIGAAIKRMEAVSEVTLSAVAELLARATGQASMVVKEQLEDLVNKRLGSS